MLMCVLLYLSICTALRAHIIVAEALHKINSDDDDDGDSDDDDDDVYEALQLCPIKSDAHYEDEDYMKDVIFFWFFPISARRRRVYPHAIFLPYLVTRISC